MPEFIHRSVGQAGAAIFRDLPQLPGENRIFSGRSQVPFRIAAHLRNQHELHIRIFRQPRIDDPTDIPAEPFLGKMG